MPLDITSGSSRVLLQHVTRFSGSCCRCNVTLQAVSGSQKRRPPYLPTLLQNPVAMAFWQSEPHAGLPSPVTRPWALTHLPASQGTTIRDYVPLGRNSYKRLRYTELGKFRSEYKGNTLHVISESRSLSYDRSIALSKARSPQSAI